MTPLQLAEVGVAVALGIALDVLVPEKRQRDVLALPSAPVARRVERVESGFRELSATTPSGRRNPFLTPFPDRESSKFTFTLARA